MPWLNKIFSLLLIVLCFGTTPAHAAATDAEYLSEWLAQPSLQFGAVRVPTTLLRNVYTAQGYRSFWTDANGLTPRGTQALDLLSNAGVNGLNPERYDVSMLRTIAAVPSSDTETNARTRLSLEILLSQAMLRYGADLQGGSVHHQWEIGQSLDADAQARLLTQAATAPDTNLFFQQLAPTTPAYTALSGALQRYRTLAASGGWAAFTAGKPIKPGMHDPRMATIRQILNVQGDLETAATQDTLYDVDTVEAVKHFQSRHGIGADGVIGLSTQNALAVPVADRIAQIELTLERMRWMPRDLGSRFVLVNIPSYTLTAVSGTQQLNMNVIVGKPDSKTPMFSKNITDVIINPSWGVPQKIAVNEMLPKLRKNPNYLVDAGYTVIENNGGGSHAVDPGSIDWQSVSRNHFAYSFRQNPGDGNALGKVKFNIPGSNDIYLHDTSNHNLFTRTERSLSHGCVRLAEPKALTEFVLRDAGWNEEKIDDTYESDAPRTVHIAPLPVHLVYWTSWVDAHGRVHFGQDIYGMDKSLRTAMNVPQATDSVKLAMN